MKILNPRYEAYLKTADEPKNWEFMSFISEMKKKYMEYLGLYISIYDFVIYDHDDFTEFINNEVKKIDLTKDSVK